MRFQVPFLLIFDQKYKDMVTFNDLRINDADNKATIKIDLVVTTGYISKIELFYYKDWITSTNAYSVYEEPAGATTHITAYDTPVGSAALSHFHLSSFDKGLFYVKVTTTEDNTTKKYYAIALDWQSIYAIGMPFVAELGAYGFNECKLPKAFEEIAVIWFALQMAVDVSDFDQIAALWDKFLRFSASGAGDTGKCNCQ